MPLIRFEVKNEYGLGDPEIYRAASKKEDPKEVLDGVSVAGLVGILRQLGDLAEFAADVFRDIHEQVMTTAARGRKMLTRIQHIESALPPLEKVVQRQRSHIHFAYISGSDWHANVRTEQSQLLCSDLPQFMMDSYEECRDPPRLYLLDKFDSAGAGACLKRYSDPSYFKRVLASSEPVKAEKVQRKKKKKGSRLRNGEVRHAVPIPRHSSSTQFASPSTDELSFSSENVSISDTRSKLEQTSESTSFNSKTRLYYIEQISDTPSVVISDTPSVVPDELEHDELSASTSKINHSDAYSSVPLDEPNGDGADDYSQHYSLQQQSAPSSSSVTWYEKTEKIKPTSPKLFDGTPVDRVQDSESLPISFEPSNLDYDTAKFGILDQVDILFDITKEPLSFSGGKQFDEVTSGTDNYTDAVNTLESEIETDSECQTKQEVNSLSNFNNRDMESGSSKIKEISAPNFDSFDDQIPISSYSSSNDCVSPRFSNLASSESSDHVQSTHSTDVAPKLDYSIASDFSESHIPDISRMSGSEGLKCDLSPESSIPSVQDELIDGTTAETTKSQDSPTYTSNMPFVKFWTNGGILGVEPSKPPDFSISNVARDNIFHCNGLTENSGTVMCNESISSNLCFVEERDKSLDGIPVKQNSQKSIVVDELDKNQDAPSNRTLAHINGPDRKENNVVFPGDDLPTTSSVESQSNECGQNAIAISASFAGLAHRLLANSLQRKVFFNHDDVSTPAQLVNNDIRRSQENFLQNEPKKDPNGVETQALYKADTNEKTELKSLEKAVYSSSLYSGSSSPPLEHMKISFHPLNGWETSKLKLEFSSANFHESTEDLMFPSFQLIPGPSVTLLDSGSESDDDTFCRSCPYSSEDLLSPHSELWGEDERSGSQKHEVTDDPCIISSSTTSLSSLMEFEQINHCSINPATGFENSGAENGTRSFQSDPNVDIPGVDSVKFSKNQKREIRDSLSTDPIDSTSQMPNELPPPPPLPPMQWRVMKPSFASVEDKYSSSAKIVDHWDGPQTQISAAHQQQEKDGPISCNAETETVVHANKKTHDQQKMNGHREPNEGSNIKEPDKGEEFLHQIRNKSFNLRRTAAAKPGLTPGPATNAGVAAILEKANVFRQAFVGSDKGGDDDRWSEG